MCLIRYLDRPGPEETKKIIGFKVTEGKRKYLCANVFPHTYLAKTISIASWLVFVPLNSLKESLWLQNKVFNVGLLYLITPVVEKLHWKEAMQDSEYNPRRSKASISSSLLRPIKKNKVLSRARVANLTKKFVHSLQSQLVESWFVTQRTVSLDCLTKHDKGRKPTFRVTSNWPSCLFGEREKTGQNTHALAILEGHTRGTFVWACTFSDRLSQAERKDYSKFRKSCFI